MGPEATVAWRKLKQTGFYVRGVAAGTIVGTTEVPVERVGGFAIGHPWTAILKHERIPFVSYVYEWTFGMLRDAALLQLSLLQEAAAEGFVLSDGSPYNVQWVGSRPVFIDIGSFVPLEPERLWPGYQQFLRLQLYPLMMLAGKHMPFHAWLRGALNGIAGDQIRGAFTWRDLFKPGVLSHLWIANYLDSYARSRGSQPNAARLGVEEHSDARRLVQTIARRLANVTRNLSWKPTASTWSNYSTRDHYGGRALEVKSTLIGDLLRRKQWGLVWDLGANDALFSRMAANHAAYVLALEGDHVAAENTYQTLKEQRTLNILPLVMDLSSPSPGQGWRGAERKELQQRGRPNLILCLAFIHHMVISSNIPLEEFVCWLGEFGATVVLEFPFREDPMVREQLANKNDRVVDYDLANLERLLPKHFRVASRLPISATRVLFVLEPRSKPTASPSV